MRYPVRVQQRRRKSTAAATPARSLDDHLYQRYTVQHRFTSQSYYEGLTAVPASEWLSDDSVEAKTEVDAGYGVDASNDAVPVQPCRRASTTEGSGPSGRRVSMTEIPTTARHASTTEASGPASSTTEVASNDAVPVPIESAPPQSTQHEEKVRRTSSSLLASFLSGSRRSSQTLHLSAEYSTDGAVADPDAGSTRRRSSAFSFLARPRLKVSWSLPGDPRRDSATT